jgi:hypothetical protein
MKKSIIVLVCVALLVVVGLLLRSRFHTPTGDTAYATTVQLSGTPGAAFTGEYVCNGKRVPISGVVPWSLTESNISSLEIRKAKAEDALTLAARGGSSSITAPSGSDSKGVRLELAGGWNVQIIR